MAAGAVKSFECDQLSPSQAPGGVVFFFFNRTFSYLGRNGPWVSAIPGEERFGVDPE